MLDKIEELLFRSADSKTESHIVCDNSRKITVPEELKTIAVQYDNSIETVTFDCPRYWDGHDMSSMQVFINYAAPDGTEGQYHCEDVTIDETNQDTMHFSWTITKNVTLGHGTVRFLICIKETDSEGNELRHWNSQICSDMTILEGLEADPPIPEKYPDVIGQILDQLEDLSQKKPEGTVGFGTPTATIDSTSGTPSVQVTASGPDNAKVFDFAFSGLKGEPGPAYTLTPEDTQTIVQAVLAALPNGDEVSY